MPFAIPFHPSYDWGMDNVIRSPVKRRLGKPKGRHPHKRLSTAFVRSAPPGRHCDGNGLYLYVQKTGTRSWIQRLVIRGRKRELGLGNAQLVLLAEAREQALANRKLARAGGDPLAEKRRSAGIPTFAEAAKRVIEQKSAGWRNAAVPRNWYRSFEIHVFPRIGRVPVSEMTSADVLEILTPIWHANPPTARIVRHRIRAVLEWAIAMDWRTDNPCDRLLPVLGSQQHVVRHRKALPHREVGAAIEKVRAAKAGKVDALALEFMVLTAARGVEVRGAVWSEIDREERVWTVPASRMKSLRAHRVPLCGRALEILDAARKLGGGGSPIVFVGKRGREMGGEQMGRLLRKHGIAAVPHGFRSSFRDWAAEETDHPREVVEAALAHVVRNPVEAAYMRSDLFERRRRLMDDWATVRPCASSTNAMLHGSTRSCGASPVTTSWPRTTLRKPGSEPSGLCRLFAVTHVSRPGSTGSPSTRRSKLSGSPRPAKSARHRRPPSTWPSSPFRGTRCSSGGWSGRCPGFRRG